MVWEKVMPVIDHCRKVIPVKRFQYILLLVFACCATSATAYAGQEDPVFLWSVETEKNTVYLLGSVHVLTRDAYPLDKRMEKAYIDSACIVLEADMMGMARPETRMKMASAGTYPDGETLKEHISEETYDALKQKAEAAGMSMERFDTLKPWLCAVTLSGMELRRMGFDPALGIDSHFYTRAYQEKKDLIFLETPEYQIDLIAGLLQDRPEDILKQTFRQLEVIEKMAADILGAWKSGDAAKMESIVNMSLKGYPDIHDALFARRNTDWTARIEKLIGQDRNVLVIVGAGHLVDEKGIVNQLRQKGYTVTQKP